MVQIHNRNQRSRVGQKSNVQRRTRGVLVRQRCKFPWSKPDGAATPAAMQAPVPTPGRNLSDSYYLPDLHDTGSRIAGVKACQEWLLEMGATVSNTAVLPALDGGLGLFARDASADVVVRIPVTACLTGYVALSDDVYGAVIEAIATTIAEDDEGTVTITERHLVMLLLLLVRSRASFLLGSPKADGVATSAWSRYVDSLPAVIDTPTFWMLAGTQRGW